MIGAAHVSTIRAIHAARADWSAAEAIRAPYVPDTPILPLEGLYGLPCEPEPFGLVACRGRTGGLTDDDEQGRASGRGHR